MKCLFGRSKHIFEGNLYMDKVLVLMATYNGGKYLQEQIDSIYSQKNVDVDVLVRDDGSKDSTQRILEENSEKYNLKWYQGEHRNVQKGFFELMQKGAGLEYKYYAFSDQDDVWDADKLEIAVKCIKDIKAPALYYAGQRLVDENRTFIEDHRLNKKRSLKARFILSDFAGCTGVFNRQLLEEIIKFEPNYMLMHDTWVLRVCLCLGGVVIVDPEPRMDYRQHSGNTLGLGHSFGATLKQVKQYLYDYNIEQVTNELVRGYGERMIPEYKELCSWICEYKNNNEYRKKLLDKCNVDFCKKGLNITYWLKIKMNKL